MIKVAVLDDYQNVFQQIVDVEKYKNKFNFKIFDNAFVDEKEAIVELEDLNLLSYLVIIVSIIPLYNLKYRRLFILPITIYLLIMIIYRDNSELVLRFSKYFNYLIPIALVIISSSFASYFKENKRVYNIIVSILIISLSLYFNYKLFLNPNWVYFNI